MTTGPLPPADLHNRGLPIISLPPGGELFRIYGIGYEPIYFAGNSRYRFNAPGGQFGVMYASRRPNGAFAETLLRQLGATVLQMSDLQARGLARLRTSRTLRMVKLYGNGLSPMGATAEVTSVHPYDASQEWALKLWQHPEQPDGIAYMARHDNQEECFALFHRTADAIRVTSRPDKPMTDDPGLLAQLLDHYQVGLAM